MTSTLIENTFSHCEFKIHHAFSPYNTAQFRLQIFSTLRDMSTYSKKKKKLKTYFNLL